ncbi:MAG: replication initiation protein [Pseudomonadota bacterium]
MQLLGCNKLSDPKRKRGNLKYSIAPELALLLKDSTVFAKLELEVPRSYISKYALALYEAMARPVRFKHVFTERFALDDFRELLGVEVAKLSAYSNLSQYAIKLALMEVNALSDFTVTLVQEKTGWRVTGVLIGWGAKDIEGRKAAYAELQRSRVGRKARITGTVEDMLPPQVIE